MPKKYTKKRKRKPMNFGILSNLFILAGLCLIFASFVPLLKDELWYKLKEWKGQEYAVAGSETPESVKDSVFARFISKKPVVLDPINKEFSIVVEKIGVNAPIVENVSVTEAPVYTEALKGGVAHAISSPPPSKSPGNTYLFAHSSFNFWQLGKYATVFNLLRKLNFGDRVHVFYKGDVYVYEVVNREVLQGWNTYPITRAVIEPTLTLQTCDPPGTTLKRLVVTAHLIEVQ